MSLLDMAPVSAPGQNCLLVRLCEFVMDLLLGPAPHFLISSPPIQLSAGDPLFEPGNCQGSSINYVLLKVS